MFEDVFAKAFILLLRSMIEKSRGRSSRVVVYLSSDG